MVGALGPAGRGAKPSLRRTAMIYTFGLAVGALIIALILASAGSAMRAAGLEFAGEVLLMVAVGAVVLQVLTGRSLGPRRQVPEHWRRTLEMDVLAAAYGLLLGAGALTRVTLSVFWVFVVLTLFVSPWAAVTSWLIFALVKGLGFAIARNRRRGVERLPSPHWQALFVRASLAPSVFAVLVVMF